MKLLERHLLPFFFYGLVALVLALLYWQFSAVDGLRLFIIGLTIVTPFVVGTIGLIQFGKDGFVREDPFHMFNILFSIGLFVLGIAEVAALVITQIPDSSVFHFTISLIQLFALITWAVGTLGYLKTSNTVLNFTNNKMLFGLLAVASSIPILIPLSFLMGSFSSTHLVEVSTNAPIAIGFALIAFTLVILCWIFRRGNLITPLGLSLFGVLLLLMRSLIWSFIGAGPIDAGGQTLALEGYVFLGAALTVARNSGNREL
ncbi:MAG: hypothetical protein ACXADL_03155 [Candidatus Thorarchaeota archaeon]|jgi:hypothetical protein